MNTYLSDILTQPQALRQALRKVGLEGLEPFRRRLQAGRFDRIVLTGMGASLYGLYPAWLLLAKAGLPALWVDAAELAHHVPGLVSERTLLWIASQSGRSAEVLRLLELFEARRPPGLLAQTNDMDSPLAWFILSSIPLDFYLLLPIYADHEDNPSTRTYLNTLAIAQLAALSLDPDQAVQTSASPAFRDLLDAANQIEAYLERWETHLEAWDRVFSGRVAKDLHPQIVLTGRGTSLTSALCGALCIQEAAKMPALGFQAAEFRHGPLEMAGPDLTALIFEGDSQGEIAGLNRKLWQNLLELGANTWLLSGEGTGKPAERRFPIPTATGIGLPLAEIVPIQLLCYYLSEKTGLVPGAFKHIGKVTTEE